MCSSSLVPIEPIVERLETPGEDFGRARLVPARETDCAEDQLALNLVERRPQLDREGSIAVDAGLRRDRHVRATAQFHLLASFQQPAQTLILCGQLQPIA